MIPPRPQNLTQQVDGQRLMTHMIEFDRWNKVSGSEGELKSLEYVEKTIAGYGYQTELTLHDAYISVPGKASLMIDGADEPLVCITHSFSRSSPVGGLSGSLVYLGHGSERDFAGQDVAGKVVLIDGIASPAVSLRASQAGAAAQVHISPHEYLHEMCISSVWGSPTDQSVSLLPSTVVVSISHADGQTIKAGLEQRPVQARLFAEVDTGWRKTPILEATLAGDPQDDLEPYVFFTGHHDTWYRGVMDNGGANATQLEVARIFAGVRQEWRRGLKIVFWSGHSQGRYSGSTWYADQHWEDLERRAVAHVNIDSTGGRGATVIADTMACAELADVARQAVADNSDQQFSGSRLPRGGDQSFWGIGIPGLFCMMSEQPATDAANASAAVFGGGKRKGAGTGWWWHTPFDTLDKIDEQILVRDTQVYVQGVWRLLADRVLPLDYGEHARTLLDELKALAECAQGQFDLSKLVGKAQSLEEAARAVGRYLGDGAGLSATQCRVLNSALMKVSRALVPIDYTNGDRFDHDPALAQVAYPALQPIRRFADLQPDSDASLFLANGMTRQCNRIAMAIDKAAGHLRAVADQLAN